MIPEFFIAMFSIAIATIVFFRPMGIPNDGDHKLKYGSVLLFRTGIGIWGLFCCLVTQFGIVLAILLGVTATPLLDNRRRFWKLYALLALAYVPLIFFSVGQAEVNGWNRMAETIPKVPLNETLRYEYGDKPTLEQQNEILQQETSRRLSTIEGKLSSETPNHKFVDTGWHSTRALRLLHGDYVDKFVTSPGFGRMRMRPPRPVNAQFHVDQLQELEPVPQPNITALEYPPLSKNENAKTVADVSEQAEPNSGNKQITRDHDVDIHPFQEERTAEIREAIEFKDSGFGDMSASVPFPLQEMHVVTGLEFTDPGTYGHVEPNKYTVGQWSHSVHKFHYGEVHKVEVPRIELVSLLKQKTPAVYVSEFLPNMEELAGNPTRPLTEFETAALAKLKQGEDIVVDDAQKPRFMLGSLRAAKQCLQCHNVERGVLLGAFSYLMTSGE